MGPNDITPCSAEKKPRETRRFVKARNEPRSKPLQNRNHQRRHSAQEKKKSWARSSRLPRRRFNSRKAIRWPNPGGPQQVEVGHEKWRAVSCNKRLEGPGAALRLGSGNLPKLPIVHLKLFPRRFQRYYSSPQSGVRSFSQTRGYVSVQDASLDFRAVHRRKTPRGAARTLALFSWWP